MNGNGKFAKASALSMPRPSLQLRGLHHDSDGRRGDFHHQSQDGGPTGGRGSLRCGQPPPLRQGSTSRNRGAGLTGAERRIAETAIRLAAPNFGYDRPKRTLDAALEKDITQAYAELATALLADQQAKDRWLIQAETLRTAQTETETARLRVAVNAAEQAYMRANAEAGRLQSRVVELLQVRDAVDRNAVLAQSVK